MAYNTVQINYQFKNAEQLIDFRSDTVTLPSPGMRTAMAKSKVGDDVYGDDPTVNELQTRVATLLGKEAGLFVTSGTQANLCAMLAHCQRGEEVITGDKYHVFIDEAGGASVLGSIVMAPVRTKQNGNIDVNEIEKTIKPDDPHCPVTRLLSLENTVSGKVQDLDSINACVLRAKKFGLSTHMDGARLMNAAIKLAIPVKKIVEKIDSVSLCLSKGLGAPAGSILAGSKDLIKKAHRARKILGGGMRQSGVLASAGLYALDNNVQRLDFDHQNATLLAQKLCNISEISVIPETVDTNMVFIKIPRGTKNQFRNYCYENSILVNVDSRTIRLVTHMDISTEKINYFVDKLKSFFSKSGK